MSSLPIPMSMEAEHENQSESLRVAFNVYSSSALFVSPSLREINDIEEDFNRTVNTPVISLSIGDEKISNLDEPINLTFTTLTVQSLRIFPRGNMGLFYFGIFSARLNLDHKIVITFLQDFFLWGWGGLQLKTIENVVVIMVIIPHCSKQIERNYTSNAHTMTNLEHRSTYFYRTQLSYNHTTLYIPQYRSMVTFMNID